MSVVALVQARMGSARLPGKVLMDIAGEPMIAHVMRRVRLAKEVDAAVLCLSDAPEDAPLVAWATRAGIAYRIGHGVATEDVLGRLAVCVRYPCFSDWADTVLVRVTGDCPLIDPGLVDSAIRAYRGASRPFGLSDIFVDGSESAGFVDGLDVEVFTAGMLTRAADVTGDATDREHVTPWMRRHYPVHMCRAPSGMTGVRKWSVDTQDDLDFVRSVYARLGPGNFGYREVLALWAR